MTYILFQDARGRALEEDLRGRYEAEKTAREAPSRIHKTLIERYDQAAALDPAALEKLKEEQPFTYLLITTPLGRGLTDLLRYLGPEAFERAGPDGQYSIAFDELDPVGQGLVRQYTEAMADFYGRIGDAGIAPVDDEDDPGFAQRLAEVDWSAARLEIQGPSSESMGGFGPDMALGGMVGAAGIGLPDLEFPLLDPDSAWATVIGRFLIAGMEGKIHWDESLAEREETLEAMTEPLFEKGRASGAAGEEAKKEIPAELAREVDLKFELPVSTCTKSEVLAKVAEATKIDIYADRFADDGFGRQKAFEGKHAIYEILDTIATRFGCEWQYEHGAILIRDREWYEKRTWIIPESWISRWRRALSDRKKLSLDEICRMAAELSDKQITHSLTTAAELYNAGAHLLTVRGPEYRLYGVLTAQLGLAAGGEPVPMSSLPPAVRDLCWQVVRRNRIEVPDGEDPLVGLSGDRAAGPVSIDFGVASGDARTSVQLTAPGEYE